MAKTINLYRDLRCDNYHDINQDLLHWIESLDLTYDDFWNPIDVIVLIKSVPLFRQWLEQSRLLISAAAVTYGTNKSCCTPHIDTPPARFKLNWPIKNTKGSWNRWFKYRGDVLQAPINHWGGKIFHDPELLEEIDRREVTQPGLIDAGIIHDVWFEPGYSTWPRIGMQCKLFTEPEKL